MPPARSPQLHVRPVRGRVIDPYRGTPDADTEAERFASRPAEPQPLATIVDTLRGLPGTTVTAAGRRYKLKRAGEILKIAFASAAPRVSVDDLSLDGDPVLAIDTLHALVPLLGAIELRVDTFIGLLDGHEAASVVAEQYRAYWIDHALHRARQIPDPKPAARPATPPPAAQARPFAPPIAMRSTGATRRDLIIVYAVLVALVLGLVGWWLYDARLSKAKLGEYCTKNESCRSDACIPSAPIHRNMLGSLDMTSLVRPTAGGPGVCTEECDFDSDCPTEMRCGTAMSYSTGKFSTGFGHEVKRCLPRAWDAAPDR